MSTPDVMAVNYPPAVLQARVSIGAIFPSGSTRHAAPSITASRGMP